MSSLIFLLILALVIFFIKQYNTLQKLTVEIKEARANIIVAYEKKLDFATALTKVQEYIEMFPEDSAAKKERAFLKTRTSSEG